MGDWCRKYKSKSLKLASETSFDRSGKTQDQPNREKMKIYRLPMSQRPFRGCKYTGLNGRIYALRMYPI